MPISRTDMFMVANEAGNGNMRDTGKFFRAMAEGDLVGNNLVLTASGVVPAFTASLHVRHASVAVAATMADSLNYRGIFAITNSSASGTAAHTVTLARGTFDGTNNRATLNTPGQVLIVNFDQNGVGQVILNSGTVTFSSV